MDNKQQESALRYLNGQIGYYENMLAAGYNKDECRIVLGILREIKERLFDYRLGNKTDKSLSSSEYKESLTKQFKLLQRASEVTVGTDNVKSLPQITVAMMQIGQTLGLETEANK